MREKLSKSISQQELQTMRELGMTNRQIADSLDISAQTVISYIGKMPTELRSKDHRKWPTPMTSCTPQSPVDNRLKQVAMEKRFDSISSDRTFIVTEGDTATILISDTKYDLLVSPSDAKVLRDELSELLSLLGW